MKKPEPATPPERRATPAVADGRRAPHPATVARRRGLLAQPKERPPHPAKVVQGRTSPAHAATLNGRASANAMPGGTGARPPHPATLSARDRAASVHAKARRPHPAAPERPQHRAGNVAQRAEEYRPPLKCDWAKPLKKPLKLKDCEYEREFFEGDFKPEAVDRVIVTVRACQAIEENNRAYNCLGWAVFKKQLAELHEPDFLDPDDGIDEVKEAFERAGYTPLAPEKRADATCVLFGKHPKSSESVTHAMVLFRATDFFNPVAIWESKLGVIGPHVLHARDALSEKYGSEVAWFK